MAGSYNHITNKDGSLIAREDFTNSIENLRDAYEAIEECWTMLFIMAEGDLSKIELARIRAQDVLNTQGS